MDRIFGRTPIVAAGRTPLVPPVVLRGPETLEVVGESHYQADLWRIVGGFRPERVRHAIQAVLAPEPKNPHDANAIMVVIERCLVGYLAREDAVVYLPGLEALREKHAAPVALEGQVVGGGQRGNGLGMLGVFLDHDPADFGLRRQQIAHIGELRTGLSQAAVTDLDDDSYDLSWYDQLSGDHGPADIATLRHLLETELDPIDRHFMLSELGKCLYKSRDAFASALEEFDAVCLRHHSEIDVIRAALYRKFGCVPVIEMYRQATIRCQKARDWTGMRVWAERGLAVYGPDAARPDAVADLEKRLAYADGKLSGPTAPRVARSAAGTTRRSSTAAAEVETLTCSDCGAQFQRVRTRGRKPHRCPACRGVRDDSLAGTEPS
jgi:hypothetical protein